MVQTWRLSSWPVNHTSTVTITFDQSRESTVVKLVQTGVPIGEKDITVKNWHNYYWNRIKASFGYGVVF